MPNTCHLKLEIRLPQLSLGRALTELLPSHFLAIIQLRLEFTLIQLKCSFECILRWHVLYFNMHLNT